VESPSNRYIPHYGALESEFPDPDMINRSVTTFKRINILTGKSDNLIPGRIPAISAGDPFDLIVITLLGSGDPNIKNNDAVQFKSGHIIHNRNREID
jgi:hypothetical protein